MELKVEHQSAIFYSLLAVGFSLSLGYMLHTSLILQDLTGKSVYSLLHVSQIGLLYNSILLHFPSLSVWEAVHFVLVLQKLTQLFLTCIEKLCLAHAAFAATSSITNVLSNCFYLVAHVGQ
jgi:hypothetical protein